MFAVHRGLLHAGATAQRPQPCDLPHLSVAPAPVDHMCLPAPQPPARPRPLPAHPAAGEPRAPQVPVAAWQGARGIVTA